MFDSINHYSYLKKNNYKGDPDASLPDSRFIIKTKSSDQKPYLIYLEEFGNNYLFVKFHPSKHTADINKYKLRIGNKTLPVKVISTCVDVIADQARKNPQLTFGIYGQWDNLDVQRLSKSSQRYRIWRTIAMRKFGADNYKLVSMSHLNIVLMIPSDIYSNEFILKTSDYFSRRFKSQLDQLKVPSPDEIGTYEM